MQNLAIVVFAGGQSARMGRDKAQLSWRGASLLERACAAASNITDRVLVVGRERPADWRLEVQFLIDETPHLGPLGGLQTALHWARDQHLAGVLAVACDLPLLDESALRWLMQAAETRDCFHGLITTRDGETEPLFSIYKIACLPLVHQQLENQRRSMRGLIENGDFDFVDTPPDVAAKLLNINTPDDWVKLQQTANRVLEL